MVSLDYSLAIQIINFLLLIAILNFLLYKPLLGMLDKRKKHLDDADAEVKRLQETTEQKMATYEETLRQSKTAALELKNEIISQGAEEAKAVIEAVRDEIPELMEQFQLKMDAEIDAARKILADHSQRLSVEIAEKVLGRSLQ